MKGQFGQGTATQCFKSQLEWNVVKQLSPLSTREDDLHPSFTPFFFDFQVQSWIAQELYRHPLLRLFYEDAMFVVVGSDSKYCNQVGNVL